MPRNYSQMELLVLKQIEEEYGEITYTEPPNLEDEFFKRIGIFRKHGPLYMANWRRKTGYYEHILNSDDVA